MRAKTGGDLAATNADGTAAGKTDGGGAGDAGKPPVFQERVKALAAGADLITADLIRSRTDSEQARKDEADRKGAKS